MGARQIPLRLTGEIPHGVYSTYTNHGCRCEPCTLAMRDYTRNYQRKTYVPKTGKRRLTARQEAMDAAQRQRIGPVVHTMDAWQSRAK